MRRRHGHILRAGPDGVLRCPESGLRYELSLGGILSCKDLDEEDPLPDELSIGQKDYQEFKNV